MERYFRYSIVLICIGLFILTNMLVINKHFGINKKDIKVPNNDDKIKEIFDILDNSSYFFLTCNLVISGVNIIGRNDIIQ